MGKGKLSNRWGCSEEDIKNARRIVRKELGKKYKKKFPKILVFDIETTPLEAYIWQKEVWKARVGADKIISEWFMLTWSAKWLFSDDVLSDRLTGKEAVQEDDSRLCKSLWKLLDEADMVIAHNGDKFDVPNINTRFIVNGLLPTSPYQQIDTKKIAAKQFGFTHNSLNGLADFFGLGRKKDTDFDLWKACKNGSDRDLRYMEEYNQHDVVLLEEVYLKLRPWIKNHPNVSVYMDADEPLCHSCGSPEVKLTNKFYYTNVNKFPTYRCKCGAYTRGRKSVIEKSKKDNILMPIAR
jgi:DNA polymerase III alpha subunit (gram-positive type)